MYTKKKKENQRHTIQREFEHVGPTLLKNPLGAGWGVVPTLRGVGYCLCIYIKKLKNKIHYFDIHLLCWGGGG